MKVQKSEGTEHLIFTLSLTFVFILGTFLYIYYSPRQKAKFLELSVLEDGKVTDSHREFGIDDGINFTLCINNQFGREIQTIIKFLIGNETTETPPLHISSVKVFEGVIQNEEQREIPFTLKIEEIAVEDRYVTISEISINGERYETEDVRSVNGANFRLIVTLYEYNVNTGSFDNLNQLWNQIWFNLTLT